MKTLWKIGREVTRYKGLLIVAMISTMLLSLINLSAPRLLSTMTGIIEGGMDRDGLDAVRRIAFTLLALYASRVLFRYLSNFLAHKSAWHLVEDMRMKTYNRMQSLPMDFFHNKQTGELMSRVVNDTGTFELLYAHIIPEMVTNVLTLTGVMIILFSTNARLTLLTCIPIPLLLLSGWILVKKVRPFFRAQRKTVARLNAQLQDNFSGMQEIQSFNQQKRASNGVLGCCRDFTVSMLRALNLNAIFNPGVEFINSLGMVIVVGFGGYLAYLNQMSVSEIVEFILYLSLFYAPITGLTHLLEQAQEALAGAERVLEILDTRSSIVDAPGAVPLENFSGTIEFAHVDFSYVEGVPVLEDISFTVKPGQMLALVGPTGVGKTTLIQLLSRFYDVTGGTIKLDGKDVKSYTLESVRGAISMVLQDTFLFNGTIAENIAYARPSASMDEVIGAAKLAHIHDNIMEMPDGYDTQVGERGTKLSGGQKQRIAIARALLKGAPLLILDEATASVDSKTETEIQRALNNIADRHTTVAIAHRLSTVRKADVILVFKDGRIVQRGTHDELVEQDGLYRELCFSQLESETLSQGDIA